MSAGTAATLRAEDLGWTVDGTTILSGVDVEIRPKVMTMVIGLNGSGKTTLLQLLAGLRKPSAGRVWLGERDLSGIGAKERSRVMALLEQSPSAHVELTVRDVFSWPELSPRILRSCSWTNPRIISTCVTRLTCWRECVVLV